MTKSLLALLVFWMMIIIASLAYASEKLVWTPINLPGLKIAEDTTMDLGIWFYGDFGWLNSGGQLWTTQDAGRSWNLSLKATAIGRPFYDSYFINSLEGWVAAWPNSLFHTKDGGVTWEELKVELNLTSVEPVSAGLVRVYFKNSSYGLGVFGVVNPIITGPVWKGGIIARTKDGGHNWLELGSCFTFPQVMGFGNVVWIDNPLGSDYYTPDFGGTISSINMPGDIAIFASPLYGWTVREGLVGVELHRFDLFSTVDGSNTWSDPILSITGNLSSNMWNYCLMSKDLGAVLWYSFQGKDGPSLLYVTYDGGKSWIYYQVPVQSEFILSCDDQKKEVWLIPYLLNGNTTIFYASIDTVTAIRSSGKLFTTWAFLKKIKKEEH